MPWQRRAQVESKLRTTALSCGSLVNVTTECSGFWHHVVVSCGRFRITQSTANDLSSPLRRAEYKLSYAKEQLHFDFGGNTESVIEDGPNLYAVILHHGNLKSDTPDFVSVRFPVADLSAYHPGEVDLTAFALPDRGTKPTDTSAEEIQDAAIPRLRLRKKTAGDQ